jgi:DNA repair protein RadC
MAVSLFFATTILQEPWKLRMLTLKITGKIKKAAELMDITVLDHVIIGQNRYLSLADEGMLQ